MHLHLKSTRTKLPQPLQIAVLNHITTSLEGHLRAKPHKFLQRDPCSLTARKIANFS